MTQAAETYDASDETQVAKKQAKQKWTQRTKDEWLRDTLKNKDARRYFWELLEAGGVFATSFNPSNAVTAFQEGRRDMALRVLADVTRATPEQFITMMKEAKEENL